MSSVEFSGTLEFSLLDNLLTMILGETHSQEKTDRRLFIKIKWVSSISIVLCRSKQRTSHTKEHPSICPELGYFGFFLRGLVFWDS